MRCPHCGYCPHCGRADARPYYPYPYYPTYPTIPWWQTTMSISDQPQWQPTSTGVDMSWVERLGGRFQ